MKLKFWQKSAAPDRARAQARREFAAAQVGRLLASWVAQNTNVNQELHTSLRKLRARSRDLANNNEYAKKFFGMVKANVVGSKGIRLQNKAKKPDGTLDVEDNRRIEAHYKKSGKLGNYDVTGKLSRAAGEQLVAETIAKDGEILVRIVRGYPNQVGFALQFIEADHLDESLNVDKLENGNAIRLGIEINGWGRPVAYYLLANHPGDFAYQHLGKKYERVPAEDMIHCFIAHRPTQLRGIPWMHAAMIGLNDLGGYREAAIIAARIGAAKMGVIYTDGAAQFAGDDEEEPGGAPVIDAEPGTFPILPDGMKLESWDPQYPHEQFGAFTKSTLRGIASGIGVSYNGLANDLEGVNFSSLRSGVQEEREAWMVIQEWMIEAFNDRVYLEWLKYSLAAGTLGLPVHKLDKFNAPEWMPRRWKWVDPLKDIQEKEKSVALNVCSVSSVIREQGNDPDEVFEEIAQEREKFKQLGIEPAQAGFFTPGGNAGEQNQNTNDPEKDQD